MKLKKPFRTHYILEVFSYDFIGDSVIERFYSLKNAKAAFREYMKTTSHKIERARISKVVYQTNRD